MFGSQIRRVISLALVGSALVAASLAAPASAAPANVTLKLPDVRITQHNPPSPTQGGKISFSFELSNIGSGPAQNITLQGECSYEYAGKYHTVGSTVQPFNQGVNLQPGQSLWINVDCFPAHQGTLWAGAARAEQVAGEINLNNNKAVWTYP